MTLGALVDAGVPPVWLRRELGRIPLEGYRLRVRRLLRGPVQATKVDVLLGRDSSRNARRGRHLRDIEALLRRSSLPDRVLARTREAFRRLAEAEAEVHGTTPEKVHFHEVGAVDAIVDIAGSMLGIHRLEIAAVYASEVPLGSGSVSSLHGRIPVPGPATLELLRGCPVRLGDGDEELTTPTGAAILVALDPDFGPPPTLRVRATGYGAGDREGEGLPNALRIVVGLPEPARGARRREGGVFEVSANLDDATPEVVGHALDRLLEAGALDAWIVPVQMKKGRPGVVLSSLATGDRVDAVREAYFRETTTFGVRSRPVERDVLDREVLRVRTPFGGVDVKIGRRHGEIVTATPEFESCRRRAQKTGATLREVYEAAARSARKARAPGESD
jgi:uncharacterized protein (TIGR00299 family) protein